MAVPHIRRRPARARGLAALRGASRRGAAPSSWPECPLLAEVVRDLHPAIRSQFPALERDATGAERLYLNNGGGTHVCERSVEAMARAARFANAQDGAVSTGERATAALQEGARAAAAAFLNASSGNEIAFHLSTSHALFNLAVALRDHLRPGDNLVVTLLDHAANVSPWESLWGEDRGLEVRRCRWRPDGTLDLEHLRSLIDRRTRVVAVTHASNALGTIVPVGAVARLAHAHGRPAPPPERGGTWSGALLVVDAVHHAYHGPIDVRRLGCDFLAFSGYKLFGPMVGVLWGRRDWLEALRPYRVEANVDRAPWKYEQGTPNNPVLAGLRGALEYLEWLGERVEEAAAGRAEGRDLAAALERGYAAGAPRLLKWALCAVREYERTLMREALEGFRRLERRGVRLIGVCDPRHLDERDPTFLFELPGRRAEEVKRAFWESDRIEIQSGSAYSVAVYRVLKGREVLRASFAHYNDLASVRRFLDALERVAA
jgi:cysteine desulfurase family protein (TIGR01976 family)